VKINGSLIGGLKRKSGSLNNVEKFGSHNPRCVLLQPFRITVQ
jgi:hypothetical protein